MATRILIGGFAASVMLAALITLTACKTVPAGLALPEGFAEYSGESAGYRAITAEGVVLRVRTVANEPPQNLKFWVEALRVHLHKAGYILMNEDVFSSAAGDGAMFEWSAPLNGEDWVYLTALAVGPERITIAEAAGEHRYFRGYRDSIIESLTTLSPAAN